MKRKRKPVYAPLNPPRTDWHPGSDRYKVLVDKPSGVAELDIFVPKGTSNPEDAAIAMARDSEPTGTHYAATKVT